MARLQSSNFITQFTDQQVIEVVHNQNQAPVKSIVTTLSGQNFYDSFQVVDANTVSITLPEINSGDIILIFQDLILSFELTDFKVVVDSLGAITTEPI